MNTGGHKILKLLGNVPNELYVALSGGVDSVTLLDFLIKGKRKVHACFFHHGTKTSGKALELVSDICADKKIYLRVGCILKNKDKKESPEEHWRNERYNFFHSLELPVATGHHLNDVLETWMFTCINGNPSLIPYSNRNVIRPFLINSKVDIELWAHRNNLKHIYDETNADTRYKRNFIRKFLIPVVKQINPGVEKTLKKKILQRSTSSNVGTYL